MDSIDEKISNIREAMTDADLDTAELDELECEVQGLKDKVQGLDEKADDLQDKLDDMEDSQDDLQANAWDILMGALPRDLDYGHALELRDHILAWNKEHNFLPTVAGL